MVQRNNNDRGADLNLRPNTIIIDDLIIDNPEAGEGDNEEEPQPGDRAWYDGTNDEIQRAINNIVNERMFTSPQQLVRRSNTSVAFWAKGADVPVHTSDEQGDLEPPVVLTGNAYENMLSLRQDEEEGQRDRAIQGHMGVNPFPGADVI